MFDYEIYAYLIKQFTIEKTFYSRVDIALRVFLEPNSHQYSTINLVLVCASFASSKSLPH